MEAVGAISELAQSLRGCELRRITRSDFETTVRKHLSGSHADQQIAQLWDKVCGGRGTIGQGELCSFLLREMQQRESTARAHLTLPLPHLPTFSSMPNTKDTVCAVLGLSTPPQYLTVSKDGSICTWSTRFHLQQSVSIGGGHGSVRGRQGHGMCITSCVMIGGTLVLATTGRDLLFYDTVSLSCLHKFQKLPFVPLCLTYGVEDEKYATSPGHLVWGDESGCVGILSFAEPHKSFFRSRLVTFNGVTDQAPLVRIRYEKAHSDWVCQVGWTGPAHYVISAAQSSSPSLLIQHVSAHRKKYIFKIRMGVSCFDYSHRLEVVATGSLDHIVRLWTPFSPHQPVASLSSHTTGIVGVAIDERSWHLFSLSRDLFLCVWDIREHHLLQTVSVKFPFTQRQPDFGPSPLLTLPLPSPTLNISCNEYMARFTLNEAAGLEGEKVDTGHTHPVCAVFFIPHFDQLVSGCEGGEVRVWDISSRRTCMKVEGCHRDQELTALAVDTEGGRILTGSRFGAIKVWDSLTGQNLQSLETPGATEVVSILHHPEMRRFLATGWNRQISVFEDKKLQLSPEPAWAGGTPHCDDIITMDYCSPYYLATGSFDGLTVVWNTDTERIVAQFRSQLKRRDQILTSATLKSPTSQHPPSATNSLSTSSRPASRRLSSYRLKSASSSHLHHVPVDKLLFLKTRVKSKARGQSTLVTSEGGHAFFWDMFSSGPPLGSFQMTEKEGEVVMAMAIDDNCRWLLAGDTAGYLHLFNIEHYCTHQHTPDEGKVEAELSWEAHSSEAMSVVWVDPGLVVSGSADHSLRMWTTDGQCVGCFGQPPQSWASPAAATLSCQISSQNPHATDDASTEGSERSVDDHKEFVQVEKEDSPSEMAQEKVLSKDYQVVVRQRMAEKLERRTQFSTVDTAAVSRIPAQFSPFQALHVQDIADIEIPTDIDTALTTP